MKTLFILLITILILPRSTISEDKKSSKEEPVEEKSVSKNEVIHAKVIDLVCYLKDGAKALTDKHLQCAQICFARGLPAALYDEKSGTIYLPILRTASATKTDSEKMVCSLMEHSPVVDKLKGHIGKTIAVKGKVSDSTSGIKRIEIAELNLE